MITRAEVDRLASGAGFRPEPVEKALRRLDDGEIEPACLSDELELRDRIGRQPMLLWKRLHVRKHRGLEGGDASAGP